MNGDAIRVLVVDDDEEDAMIIADQLRDDPNTVFDVEHCPDLDRAWQCIERQQHDVYLVDYRLGPESGMELIRRAQGQGLARPMILLTGQGSVGVDERALQAGAADYLVKGRADGEQLARAIRYALERQEFVARLTASEARYRHMFEQNPAPLLVIDAERLQLVAVNDAVIKMVGYSREEMLGMTLADLLEPEEWARYLEARKDWPEGYVEAGIWRCRRKDGSHIYAEIVRHEIQLEGMSGKLVLARNVTQQVEAERKLKAQAEALAFAATHDRLTGMAQLAKFERDFAALTARGRETGCPVALYFIDLDRFHSVNETLGPEIGDRLLITVAQRIREAFPVGSIFARFAGDEFVVATLVGPEGPEPEAFAGLARAVIAAPVDTDEYSLYPSCSIGIALWPEHHQELSTLMRLAEAAMMRAKDEGRNRSQMFDARMGQEIQDRLALGARLRAGVQGGELMLHYQPFFGSESGRLAGFEALARWENPDLGMVAPSRFIPVAEQLGLILDIGRWVLNEACRQQRSWRDAGLPLHPVAVNVSALQLQQADFAPFVSALVRRYRLPEGALEIELTESALLVNPEQVLANLDALKEVGVRLSIDDFGTGYSSLSYLKRLSLDKLKVDRSFVQGLPDNANDAAITHTIVTVAHQLGMSVTAEGVETEAQREYLRSLGCEYLQGFMFGRPVPAAEAVRFIEQERASA